MKVSIIVPVYNVEKYLEKCLDSLVNQTLKDIEIIIVNDGSPDNSDKIIDKYVKKYKNMKSYEKENGGLSSARNYGLKKANGEYISFIDSDDYIDKNMMKIMYEKADKENLDIVVCDTIEVNNEKNIYKKSNFGYADRDVKNYIISPPMAPIRLYKKSILGVNPFKEGILYEDLNFNPSLVLKTKKIAFINEGLYYYVQHPGSIMKQVKYNDKLLDIFEVLENNKNNLISEYSEEVEYLYIQHLLRTASLRFVDYEDESKKLITKIVNIIKKDFPNYRKNIYYRKSSIKFKIICYFAYHKNIIMLKLIKKVGG